MQNYEDIGNIFRKTHILTNNMRKFIEKYFFSPKHLIYEFPKIIVLTLLFDPKKIPSNIKE